MAFPVTCPSCAKAFQLATDVYERKVAGKIVSIKCKQCQTGIRVDATEVGTLKVIGMTPPGGSGDMSVGPKPPEAQQPKAAPAAPATAARPAAQAGSPAAAAPAPASPMRMRQPTLIGMVNPNASAQTPAVAAPKPAAHPLLWAVDSAGAGDDRELNDDEIRAEIQAGTISPQTLVWRDGMDEWLEIDKVPELQKFLAPARPEPKPAPLAAPRELPFPKARSTGPADEADAETTMIFDRSSPNASFEPFPVPSREQEVTARAMFSETAKLAETPPAPPLPAAGRPAAFGKSPPLGKAARPPISNAPPAPLADAPPPPLPAVARPIGFGKTTLLGQAPPPPAARPAPFGKTAPLGDDPPAALAPPPPPPPPAPRPAPLVQLAPAPQPEPPPQAEAAFLQQAAAAPEPPAPPLPRPAAQAPLLAAAPWGDALPSAKPATPALPTAYAPDPFAVAATTDLDFPNPRSKKPLVIAAIVGVVAVIAIGIAIASSSSPPPANIAAPPPVPKVEPTVEAQPTEPTPTSEPARDEVSGTSAPATQPQTPSGNFSDLFSKGVKAGSAPGTKAFDEGAARAALADLLKTAAACKEPGGPTGQASATITFEPGGSVSGVTVGAPFAGSSTATCIVTTFKRAKVAPFNGLPGTVSQVISLR